MDIAWGKDVKEKFEQMVGRIPPFLRTVAHAKVSKKAEALAQSSRRTEILEKDMVDAFFSETPFGFHGPMKTDMEELGIDYVKYGYQR